MSYISQNVLRKTELCFFSDWMWVREEKTHERLKLWLCQWCTAEENPPEGFTPKQPAFLICTRSEGSFWQSLGSIWRWRWTFEKKRKKKIHCWQFVMNQWIKTLALCAFLHIHHIRPLGGILLSKMNRQINNYYHTCRISQKASLKTLFSLLGLMFVDTTSSHRKWFVNNTLPVTGAKSVQTDGDLLHGWRVQLFWRLSSGRTKRFLAAGWILQPPRNRSLLFKHQVQGLFHPLRWSLQTIIKTQNGANPNTVLSCCTTIGFIGPSPNETDCSDVKRCFVLNSEVNTSWRTSSSNFSKKWPLLLQWKNSGFLNTAFYKLKCFDLGRNKWLGRLKEKNCT